jgi:hypothetical protein
MELLVVAEQPVQSAEVLVGITKLMLRVKSVVGTAALAIIPDGLSGTGKILAA